MWQFCSLHDSALNLLLGVPEMPFHIRSERQGDHGAIRRLTETAFQNMPFAEGDEQEVIERLRSSDALSLSLVATIAGDVVGQITFSPASAADTAEQWFALGPVSVLPQYQGIGIGSALITRGMQTISETGALGCILTGNPDYYRRFGFELSPDHAPANEPKEFFMIKLFGRAEPKGRLNFHEAFYGDV